MRMRLDDRTSRLAGRERPGGLMRVVSYVLAAVLVVLGAMFSLILLAVLALVLLVGGGWLWWKTRAMRQEARAAMAAMRAAADQAQGGRAASPQSGDVIEGEAVRVTEEGDVREAAVTGAASGVSGRSPPSPPPR
jgi:type II secretory pathway pseudopilin PulG